MGVLDIVKSDKAKSFIDGAEKRVKSFGFKAETLKYGFMITEEESDTIDEFCKCIRPKAKRSEVLRAALIAFGEKGEREKGELLKRVKGE